MKQVIRKPPVGHCSRHFHFKDGLSLLQGMIQKCLPCGDLSMAKLFFNCISVVSEGNTRGQRSKYSQPSVSTSDNTISSYSPV